MTISKVALYARVSTHDKDQNPENQLIKLRSFAERHGWGVYDDYKDFASGAKFSRPDYDKMLKEARQRRFGAILVVRLDRLGRTARPLLDLLEELKRFNVELICTEQPFDTSSPMGKACFTILAAMAELELELIRERTMDGLDRARAQGKRLGRPQNAIPTERILVLNSQGLSLKRIGREVGMTPQGVKKRLIKAGVTKRVENRT